MREDGKRLATDVLPCRKRSGPFGVVFSRTPYQMNGWVDGGRAHAQLRKGPPLGRGRLRLRGAERARPVLFRRRVGHPRRTHHRRLRRHRLALSKQAWSNGHVGLIGCSSTAEWQMAVASLGHPALKAIVPQGYGAGVGRVGEWMEQGELVPGRRPANAVHDLALRRAARPCRPPARRGNLPRRHPPPTNASTTWNRKRRR